MNERLRYVDTEIRTTAWLLLLRLLLLVVLTEQTAAAAKEPASSLSRRLLLLVLTAKCTKPGVSGLSRRSRPEDGSGLVLVIGTCANGHLDAAT